VPLIAPPPVAIQLRSILKRRSVSSVGAAASPAANAANAFASSRRVWSPPASLFASSSSSASTATSAAEPSISSIALARAQQLRDKDTHVRFGSDVSGGEANTDIVLSVFFGDIGSRVASSGGAADLRNDGAASRAQLSERFYDWTEANALASLPVTVRHDS
jgi:hypothetical protein